MKKLSKNEIDSFLERFDSSKDGEFRSLEINSPTQITLNFAVQDTQRGFDWINLKVVFEGVSEALLADNSNVEMIDMSEGINITQNGTSFAFSIVNSTFKLSSLSIIYEELNF